MKLPIGSEMPMAQSEILLCNMKCAAHIKNQLLFSHFNQRGEISALKVSTFQFSSDYIMINEQLQTIDNKRC